MTAVYDPSENDPRIVAALDAERRMERAGQARDAAAFDSLFAPGLIVNAPINKVVHRDDVLARMRSGQIAYEPDFERSLEFAGVRGDLVVIMGEEIVRPTADAPHAGKVIRRRFTDVWKSGEAGWKLVIRHATITAID